MNQIQNFFPENNYSLKCFHFTSSINNDEKFNEYNEENNNSNLYLNNCENIPEENIEKYVDLSFLEIINRDTEKDNIPNNKNSKLIPENNFNYNKENINNNINIEKNRQIYKLMLLNKIYQNYKYNQQISYIYHIINNNQQINNAYQNICKKNYNKPKRKINKQYMIKIANIKNGKEKRTTVRMMNIPTYFRPSDLSRKLDEKFSISPDKHNRVYNFINIPIKEHNNKEEYKNTGYAFINFVHPKHIIKFYSLFNGKHLKLKTSKKLCIITFAAKQGININRNCHEGSNNYMIFTDTKNHFELFSE